MGATGLLSKKTGHQIGHVLGVTHHVAKHYIVGQLELSRYAGKSMQGNFRQDRVYPAYKRNRKVRKPLCYTELREFLKEYYTTQEMDSLEGDDVLGILSTRPVPIDEERIIVSVDKDFLTIPGRYYNFRRPKDGVQIVTEPEADYAHMVQTLTGDSCDGYPGCPGVGPKKAARILGSVDPSYIAMWPVVIGAFGTAGLSKEEALPQARCARILRHGDYNTTTRTVNLWLPP